jgi:hypothetical protein
MNVTMLRAHLKRKTCPFCGSHLSSRHARAADGKILPMTYVCTHCGRNPREALANSNHEPAGQSPEPEGGTNMATKKAQAKVVDPTIEDQNGKAEEAPKGRVHTIAKPRSTPMTGKPKTATTDATPQPPDDASEIVVFAFRLTRAERDEIHAATGSAKASRFIKTLALAGARGDTKAIQEIVDEIHATSR